MISVDKITEIFCIIDDFCQEFEKAKSGHVLLEQTGKRRRRRLPDRTFQTPEF